MPSTVVVVVITLAAIRFLATVIVSPTIGVVVVVIIVVRLRWWRGRCVVISHQQGNTSVVTRDPLLVGGVFKIQSRDHFHESKEFLFLLHLGNKMPVCLWKSGEEAEDKSVLRDRGTDVGKLGGRRLQASRIGEEGWEICHDCCCELSFQIYCPRVLLSWNKFSTRFHAVSARSSWTRIVSRISGDTVP